MNKIEEFILDFGYRCVLFRRKDSSGKVVGKNYLIADSVLLGVFMCHEGSRMTYIRTGEKTNIRKIAQEIRLVFDHNGVLIARRTNPNAPLRLTGKGAGKLIKKISRNSR